MFVLRSDSVNFRGGFDPVGVLLLDPVQLLYFRGERERDLRQLEAWGMFATN